MRINQNNNYSMCHVMHILFAVFILVTCPLSAASSDELVEAIKKIDLQQVKLMSDDMSTADINQELKYGNTYLHTAVTSYSNILGQLLRPLRIDLIKKEEAKNRAIEKRNQLEKDKPNALEIIKHLLDKGADPKAKNKAGMTPLLSMNQRSQVYTEIIKLLIEYGASIDDVDKNGDTLLLKASKRSAKDFDFTSLFILGADINIQDKRGYTPLMNVIKYKPEKAIKLFLEQGADIYLSDKSNATALHHAAANNKWRTLYLLLETGADIEAADKSGQTAISYAANAKKWNMVRRLLKLGANANIPMNRGGTVADAIFNNKFLDLSDLITKDTFRVVEDASNKTKYPLRKTSSLDRAISDLNVELVEKYLSLGLNPNDSADTYNIPLHEISKHRWFNDKTLYEQYINNERERSIYEAQIQSLLKKEDKVEQIFNLLIDNGADVNIRDKDNKTALMIAAENGNHGAVKFLLKNGADINARDRKNTTPLMYAAENEFWNMTKFLIKNGADVSIPTMREVRKDQKGGVNLQVIGTTDGKATFAKPGAINSWPLEIVFSGYMDYLREGATRRQQYEQNTKDEEIKQKIKAASKDNPVFHIPDIKESQNQVISEYWVLIKSEINNYALMIKNWMKSIFKNDRSNYGSVFDIDYGNEEFKDLLIMLIEAFPKDYELDLDISTYSFTYQKIFERIEGVDPEIKEAASKLKVKYKSGGLWFSSNLHRLEKGELDSFPIHATEGLLEDFEKYKAAVKRSTGKEY